MPEWSIGTVSKTVVRVTVPRVRIPVFPLIFHKDKTLKVAHELPQRFLFMANNVWAKFRIWAVVTT